MNKKSFWISLFLFLATFLIMQNMHIGSNVVVSKKNLDKIPLIIGDIRGVDIPLGDSILKILNPDVIVFRDYIANDGRIINVYIGYYGTSKGGRSAHTPEGCYPGAGWAIQWEKKVKINIEGKRNITVNSLLVNKGGTDQLVYHWYQSDKGIVIADGIQQNLNRFKRRLLYNRDDGAFIRVSVDINNYPQTKENIENFIRQLFPLLVEYWPEEINIK